MVDNSHWWHGELGTVELVEPESAVPDEGGVGRGWAGVCHTKPSGTAKSPDKLSHLGSTTGVLAFMVMPCHSGHRRNRMGAVYASDICQFHDNSYRR
jgi:hypothetical protein